MTESRLLVRRHLLWCIWQREERERELATFRHWIESLRGL